MQSKGRTSTRTWIVVPTIVLICAIGELVAERRADERIDEDLAEWRRQRPHPRPKAR